MRHWRPAPWLPHTVSGRTALAYALVAGLWITLSDRLVAWLVRDPALVIKVHTVKGWVFVIVTALLLRSFLRAQADHRISLLEAILRARVLPCRWIAATGRWEFHPRAARMLGLSREALSDPDAIARLLHPADLGRFSQARSAAREGGLGTFEARVRTARGKELWTQWTLRASREGLLGVVQDISHLHETRTRLLNHQKRELATLLASGLAHDLRNLLQAIHGSAELLEVTYTGSDARQISTLKLASERAETLVRRFLKVVREKEQVSFECCSLNAQVEETASLLRLALPRDFAVDLQIRPGLSCARFDPGQVLQVLMNLGINARDAQGERGLIRLSTGQEVPPWGCTEHVFAEVADAGPGIPPEVQERLFDPFFTTKGGGTGLGLATAQSIAKAHGGKLTFDSAPGQGTRFRLWLPLEPLPEAPAEAPA